MPPVSSADVRDEETSAGPGPAPEPARPIRDGLAVVVRGVPHARAAFTAAVLGSVAYGTGTAASGWVLGRVTDDVLAPAFAAGRIGSDDLVQVASSLSAVAVLTAVGVWCRRVFAGRTMFALQAMHREAVIRRYLSLPMSWHQRHPAGELLSIANSDVEGIWQVMAPLPMSLGVAVMLLVAAVAMVLADPVLALVGLVVLPAVVAVNAVFQRRMSPKVMRAQELRADVSAVAHESFDGALVVKVAGIEDAETARFAAASHRLRAANIEVGVLRGLFDPVIEGLPTIATLLVLLVGTWRVGSGAAQTGDVVQVAYLLALLAFPVRALGWVLGELPRTVVCWGRVSRVLQAEVDGDDGDDDLPTPRGPLAVSVANVHHVYTDPVGRPVPALTGASLDVPAGSTVAVVGPTGSGKSTLAGMLVRLVDPREGSVRIDDVDVRSLRRSALTRAVCLVAQTAFVFDDTVRGNITLGEDFSDDEIRDALERAQATSFVDALPHGWDTQVGERGASLSGGQRQRLTLARALVRRPRLLVLDDATSAVDPAVEARILAGLRQWRRRGRPDDADDADDADGADEAGTTVVVVAYRQATIALADHVVWLDDGRVAARGTHEELLATTPAYADLVHAYERQEAAASEDAP